MIRYKSTKMQRDRAWCRHHRVSGRFHVRRWIAKITSDPIEIFCPMCNGEGREIWQTGQSRCYGTTCSHCNGKGLVTK